MHAISAKCQHKPPLKYLVIRLSDPDQAGYSYGSEAMPGSVAIPSHLSPPLRGHTNPKRDNVTRVRLLPCVPSLRPVRSGPRTCLY
jgi:hypothetical protein